jgi:lipopolysaccharide biosynthesis protein
LPSPSIANHKNKRALIFAHVDPQDRIDDYVVFLVGALKRIAQHVVFVSTAKPSRGEIEKLNGIADRVIVRENIGYDFMSWKTGLADLPLENFDELVLCNDSAYGPLWPIEDAFDEMGKSNCDFWGLTANRSKGLHLQSYFIVFRKSVLSSDAFKRFWNDVGVQGSKHKIIRKYEVGLTSHFVKHGFKPDYLFHFKPSYFLTTKIDVKFIFHGYFKQNIFRLYKNIHLNPYLFFWDALLKEKVPTLKIQLVKFSLVGRKPAPPYESLIQKIKASTSLYDTTLIDNHIHRIENIKESFGFAAAGESPC